MSNETDSRGRPWQSETIRDLLTADRLVEVVVAELNFGFWRYLVARRYPREPVGSRAARRVHHGHHDLGKRRSEVEAHLADLMLVRNRAAHREPINRRNLARDLAAAIAPTSWINPEAGFWVAEKSVIPLTLAAKP